MRSANKVYYGEVLLISQDGSREQADPANPDFQVKFKESSSKMKNGFGILVLLDDNNTPIERFCGEWFEDQMNGIFKISYKNGSSFEGKMKFNRRSGYGQFRWKDQKTYHGFWKDDKMNGTGIFSDGEHSLEGTFINNYFLQKDSKLVCPFKYDDSLSSNPQAQILLSKVKEQNKFIRNFEFKYVEEVKELTEFSKASFSKSMVCLLSNIKNNGRTMNHLLNELKQTFEVCYIDLPRFKSLQAKDQGFQEYRSELLESFKKTLKSNGIFFINLDHYADDIEEEEELEMTKTSKSDFILDYLFYPQKLKEKLCVQRDFELADFDTQTLDIGIIVFSKFNVDASDSQKLHEMKLNNRFGYELDLFKCNMAILR